MNLKVRNNKDYYIIQNVVGIYVFHSLKQSNRDCDEMMH